jgi:hypothetical protein
MTNAHDRYDDSDFPKPSAEEAAAQEAETAAILTEEGRNHPDIRNAEWEANRKLAEWEDTGDGPFAG